MESERSTETLPDPGKQNFSQVQRLLLEKRLRGDVLKLRQEAVTPRASGSKVPLSAEQRRIWLHASQQPALAIYNEPITIYRYGSFSLSVLEASLNEIVRRHEAWRTHFTPNGESLIADDYKVKLSLVDLSGFSDHLREAEALRIATEDAQQPFRLEALPLFRARVIKVSSEEHRLYLTLHHIIFDGVSLSRILLPELATIYAELETGKASTLPAPSLQYGDYAIWRERQLESPEVKEHLKYWAKQLSGELPVLLLPADRPRPAAPSHSGSMHRFEIPNELMQGLKTLSRAHSVTLYTTLLTAFEVLLFRYSGQEDLIVGSATDARRRSELEHVMGYFLDTLAIRTRPGAGLKFSDYLSQTQDTIFEAFGAADIPFDRIVHEVNPRRESSHHPIFQAFFSMRPAATGAPAGWKLAHLDVTVNASKFDIYLELGELLDRIEGRILYSTDLFDESTIRRIESHFIVLLQAICHEPDSTLGTLPILTTSERAALIGADNWNRTRLEFPEVSLEALIEEEARRRPHALAVICGEQQWTYSELIDRSNAVAKALRRVGVKQGALVAIALERSADLLAGLLGILKLGAAYLPLDTLMPTARIGTYLEDAEPAAILTQRSLVRQVGATAYLTILLDEIDWDQNETPDEKIIPKGPQGREAFDATAYVIYTSGTTGAPKAVEISQRSLVNLLMSMQNSPGFKGDDVLLALTSVSFDIAALELFLPLISGGTVAIASREEVQDPHLLAALIKQSHCSVVQGTPATWRTLLRSGWQDGRRKLGVKQSPLRILCGGEALTADLAAQLLATGAELWNMYGPTETTIWSMVHQVVPGSINGTSSITVGKPIANTQAYILDGEHQLLPVGVRGELFLGGEGLAKGYRGRPQQTAERFITAACVGGSRLYRTGDLALRRPDGNIEVVGRSDNQVKIRGYRVELEAVEGFVLQHPEVSAAVACAWPEQTGEMRLSAYVVGRNGTVPNLREMRAFLADRLPDYMIPSDIFPLAEIPLTVNGKVDRLRLSAPAIATILPAVQAEEGSAQENGLAAIWAELLGLEKVGLEQDFFTLGGHSVLVAELQQRIHSAFGLQVPMAALFHQPTVRLQAELIERLLQPAVALPPGVCTLQRVGDGDPLFWTHFANEGLARAIGNDQPFYSVVLTVEDMVALGEHPDFRQIAWFHMQKILSTKAQGPYRIGGFCIGGVVAYEVARLLRKAGHEVSVLVLVDSPNPNPHAIRRAFRYFRWVGGNGGLRAVVYSLNKRLSDYTGYLEKRRLPRTEMRTAQEMIEAAGAKYKPGDYDGDVVLIQASDRLHMDLLPPWKDVVRGALRNVYVDGHHDDLMKAHNVQDVGRAIRANILPERLPTV